MNLGLALQDRLVLQDLPVQQDLQVLGLQDPPDLPDLLGSLEAQVLPVLPVQQDLPERPLVPIRKSNTMIPAHLVRMLVLRLIRQVP
jgi:hypothetical protein